MFHMYLKPHIAFTSRIHQLFPRAVVETIAESGHWPHYEQPQQFQSMVLNWLRDNDK